MVLFFYVFALFLCDLLYLLSDKLQKSQLVVIIVSGIVSMFANVALCL